MSQTQCKQKAPQLPNTVRNRNSVIYDTFLQKNIDLLPSSFEHLFLKSNRKNKVSVIGCMVFAYM